MLSSLLLNSHNKLQIFSRLAFCLWLDAPRYKSLPSLPEKALTATHLFHCVLITTFARPCFATDEIAYEDFFSTFFLYVFALFRLAHYVIVIIIKRDN